MSSCGECSSVMIDNQFLLCYPESPAFLTYRARLEGTSETDSGSLTSLIEEWVTGGGANVTVTGILMTVDSHCSVAISSLSQPECSPPSNTEPRTNSTSTTTTKSDVDRSGSDESYSTTIAIIAGVMAIFLFIFVAIVIIIIVASKKYVVLITNDAIIKNLESRIYFDTDIGPLEVAYQPQLMRHMERLKDREKRDMRWWTPPSQSLLVFLQLKQRICMRFCHLLPLPPASSFSQSLSLKMLELRRTMSMIPFLDNSNSTFLTIN